MRRARQLLVENGADHAHHLDIAALGPAADIVGLAEAALPEHEEERPRMVLDMEPVADIGAAAIDRQLLAFDRVENDERDQLLGKLPGAVIVRAVGRHDRQPVSPVPGAHEMVGAGLARGIGAVRPVSGLLAETGIALHRSEHLVGRDVMKAEALPRLPGKALPVRARGFEKGEGPEEVCRNKIIGTVDGPIDMGLGGQMHDGVRPVPRKHVAKPLPVTNIGDFEPIPIGSSELTQRRV